MTSTNAIHRIVHTIHVMNKNLYLKNILYLCFDDNMYNFFSIFIYGVSFAKHSAVLDINFIWRGRVSLQGDSLI